MSPQSKPPRVRPPLDEAGLREVALGYVSKYATTRAKLCAYLARKLRDRGWEGDRHPDLHELAERFADLGFVNDSAFAASKARELAGRGYGKRRLIEQLRRAGVNAEDSQEAVESANKDAVTSALRFARRRRIGPFANEPADRAAREKALAAMIRAGHDFALASTIVRMEPGADGDLINLCESSPSGAA